MSTAPPETTPEPTRDPTPDRVTADESRAALVRLVLIVAAGVIAGVVAGIGNTLLVIFALVAMIMLHELGHFATAKWGGMKVTQYFLGFGPRLWSIRRGETEYGVKAIPAGGYVKIIGMNNLEEVDPADEPRTYRQAPYRWRLAVGLAGSTMHFLLALVLLFALYSAVGLPNFNRPTTRVDQVLALASGESPAQRAGFHVGDVIVAVDGQPVHSWTDMTNYVKARPGQTVAVTVRRGGHLVTLNPTTVDLSKVDIKNFQGTARPTQPTGFIGISAAPTIERGSPLTAAGRSVVGLVRTIRGSVSGLIHLFSPTGLNHYANALSSGKSGSSQTQTDRPVGIVGAVSVASQFTGTEGFRGFLLIFIQIDIFIGVFNLLPVLPFDGGHVAIATYERIRSRGRRYYADAAKMMPVMYAVLLLVMLIFVTTNYLDITHPVHATP
ncbi:MAG TPA: RIP metalloprotease [Acidimicrobiales bacterium]|nr:RIP metalloprotease [Acidimicrobiales bacterium]